MILYPKLVATEHFIPNFEHKNTWNWIPQYTVYPQTLADPAEYTMQSKAKILKKFLAKP